MLTFPQIRAKLSSKKKALAKLVKIDDPRIGYKKGFPFFIAKTHSDYILDGKGRMKANPSADEWYLTNISILDKKGHIELSCSCPDFLFRHEVALADKDASTIEYSNGDYPKDTNPLLEPTCCKHCLAFYEFLYKKGLVK